MLYSFFCDRNASITTHTKIKIEKAEMYEPQEAILLKT